MVAGVPAVVKGEVDEMRDTLLWFGHRAYQSLPPRYRESCVEISPEDARRSYDADPEAE
jgi:hypothetical protein